MELSCQQQLRKRHLLASNMQTVRGTFLAKLSGNKLSVQTLPESIAGQALDSSDDPSWVMA